MLEQVTQTLSKIKAAERYGIKPSYIIMSSADHQLVADAADREGLNQDRQGIIVIDNMHVGGVPELEEGYIMLGQEILSCHNVSLEQGTRGLMELLRSVVDDGEIPDFIILNDTTLQEAMERHDDFYYDEINALRFQGFRVFSWHEQGERTVDIGKFIMP